MSAARFSVARVRARQAAWWALMVVTGGAAWVLTWPMRGAAWLLQALGTWHDDAEIGFLLARTEAKVLASQRPLPVLPGKESRQDGWARAVGCCRRADCRDVHCPGRPVAPRRFRGRA